MSVERIQSLDGLRALSITIVTLSHLLTHFDFHTDRTLGIFGVKVFFIISGFLITLILLDEFESTGTINLKKFYFRRTLRIFPAYYFYLFVFFTTVVLEIYQIPLSKFVSPLFYTSNYFTTDVWELGHTWSLSVEEQFYLFYPGLFILLGSIKTRKVLVFTIFCVPLVRLFNLFYFFLYEANVDEYFFFGFHTNVDALATGCLMAFYRTRFHLNESYLKFLNSKTAFAFAIAILCFVLLYSNFTLFFFSFGWTILTLVTGLAIDWLIYNDKSILGILLNLKSIKYIGVLSYSIYLWQQPFSKYSESIIWTHYPLNIIMIIIFSLFSYHIIEKPFLRFRQNLEKSYFAGVEQEEPKMKVI